VQGIPQDQRAAASRYEERAGAILDSIQGERRQRAMWERWYAPDGKPRWAWAGFAIFGVMIAVYVLGMGLAQAKILPPEALGPFLTVGILGTYALGMVGWFAAAMRRGSSGASSRARIGARCSACGAPQPFEVGRAVEHCAYCGASLLAGPAVMSQGLDAARAELRREALARYRVERNAMVAMSRWSQAGATPYIVVGSFLPVTVFGTIAFTFDFVFNDKSDTPLGGLLLLWLIALFNGSLLGAVYLFRKARRTPWRRLAEELAGRLQGRVITRGPEWVAWLNELWVGPYELARLLKGPYWHVVVGRVGMFPVAADLEPVVADKEHARPRAEVLLATYMPPDTRPTPAPPDLASRARALGFGLSASSAGFVAAYEEPVSRLAKMGTEQAVRTLVDVAALLATWATRVAAPAAGRSVSSPHS
jgi:hypothetical protein